MLALASALVGVAPAEAAGTTCSYDPGTRVVTVGVRGSGAYAYVYFNASGISVYGVADCGGATPSNADKVKIVGDEYRSSVYLYTSEDVTTGASLYGPGHASEGDGTKELELEVDLGPGYDYLSVSAPDTEAIGRDYVLGAAGLNLNGTPDLEVTLAGVDSLNLRGGPVDDTMTSAGGGSTGAAWASTVNFYGMAGSDRLHGALDDVDMYGGEGNDVLIGGSGQDVLVGGPGRDTMKGGAGSDYFYSDGSYDEDYASDTYDGGGGTDYFYAYTQRPEGVNVLQDGTKNDGRRASGSTPAEQDGVTGMEYVTGTPGADRISGTDGNDSLYGQDGDDRITGLAGYDYLYGGDGNDKIDAQDGVVEQVDGGAGGGDTCVCDPGEGLNFP